MWLAVMNGFVQSIPHLQAIKLEKMKVFKEWNVGGHLKFSLRHENELGRAHP